MIRSRTSVDEIAPGERHMLVADTAEWAKPGTLPACIYSTGWHGWPTAVTAYDSFDRLVVLKLAEKFSVLSIDAGGTDTFGNDAAITAVGQGVAWQKAQGRPGPFLIAASSMGFADTMAWARTHQSDVLAVVGFLPAVNMNDLQAANRAGVTPALNAAYGGLYDPVVHGPTHNPLNYADQLNFPILILYAGDDAVAVPAYPPQFAAAAPHCTAINMGNVGGHTQQGWNAASVRPELEAFLKQKAGY